MKNSKLSAGAAFALPALRTLLLLAAGSSIVLWPGMQERTLEDIAGWWMPVCTVVNFITIAVLYCMLKREGRSYFSLFKRPREIKGHAGELLLAIGLMLALGVGAMVAISFLFYGYMPTTNMQPIPIWASALSLALFPVSIVFAEIPFYLGYCAPKIRQHIESDFIAIAYPLFFYGLQHCFMPVIFDAKYMASRFFVFVPLLIMLGIWYYKKKDISPLMIGHAVLDTTAAIQVLVISIFPSLYDIISAV